jgi:xanthine dehydrogenase accessory factor
MKFKKLHKNINFNSALIKAKVMNALGSTPNKIDDFMLIADNDIFGTIGGGTLEFQVINESKKLLINNKKESILKVPLGPGIGQCCGGFVEIKLTKHSNFKKAIKNEVFDESDKLDLYIFGAGHIGQSLITKTNFLNFNTYLIDSRESFLKQNNLKHINYLLSSKPWQIVNHLNKKSMYVVVTHSHDFDFKIVNEILKNNTFSYLGLIGSNTKKNKFYKRLEQLGHKKQLINQLECPIGASIGKSKDPEEISFSILARLIKFKNLYNEDIKKTKRQINEF